MSTIFRLAAPDKLNGNNLLSELKAAGQPIEAVSLVDAELEFLVADDLTKEQAQALAEEMRPIIESHTGAPTPEQEAYHEKVSQLAAFRQKILEGQALTPQEREQATEALLFEAMPQPQA